MHQRLDPVVRYRDLISKDHDRREQDEFDDRLDFGICFYLPGLWS